MIREDFATPKFFRNYSTLFLIVKPNIAAEKVAESPTDDSA
jgi:hypothetical protein